MRAKNASKVERPSEGTKLLEAIRQGETRVDVNVLLVQLTRKTEDPSVLMDSAERMLELTRRFEEARLQGFLQMAGAIIDVKNRDPDEIEKRKNNRMIRYLKGVVGGSALIGLGGGIATILLGGDITVIGALIAAGCLGLALTGPLASGESLSSRDVVRIVRAIRPTDRIVDQGKALKRRRR